MSEKRTIERETAILFLRLFNRQTGTHFSVTQLSDAPDVRCDDTISGNVMFLEITLLEDLPGEVRHVLGRGPQPLSPTTGTAARGFFQDVVPSLKALLEDKLLAAYGPSTALVIRQVAPIWGPSEWAIVEQQIREEVFRGREANYGAGVWIICIDTSTWPATDTLFKLAPPSPGAG